jgi:hypothetical protein
MRGLTFTCSSSELIPGLGAGNCADSVLVNGARCPVACGEDILVASDVPTDVGNEVLYFCLIVVYLIAFRIFGFLAFKFINHVKR